MADETAGEGRTRMRRRSAGRAATMADVAREAGVSAQTVSRALRDAATVTPETLRLVQEAVRKTRYVQNLSASHLASNRSMTVAAIIPNISASIFAETIQGLADTLSAEGYQIFLGDTEYRADREEALIRSFLGRRPDGIFLIGAQHSRTATALLKRAGVPVIESWEWPARPIDGLVGFSNRASMAAVATHLVERGRRRPVFAGVLRPGDHRAAERRDGFAEAVGRLLPGAPPRIVDPADLPLAIRSGEALLDRALALHPDADALVFSSDLLAAGALLACDRRGIAVPDRIAITGFGDYDIARELNPALTTIAVPSRRIGSEAGQMLLAAMRGGGGLAGRRIDVGTELVIREST